GIPIRFEGNYKEKSMVFEGVSITKDGEKTLYKMTYFLLDENTIQQYAEQSTDDGKTWTVSFDLKYIRKK
ncbi:MAG: hypothetical protein K1X72_26590, partial [Pyrinomonadaceae bacterium]|nr:hypothetical protein [Pyrinomonadaceae bacterium]